MSIYDQYSNPAQSRIANLEKELTDLKAEIQTLTTQAQMLKGFISLSNVATGRTLIRATLQKNLDVAIKQANAELGSLFLLDRRGRVLESLLARGATDQVQKKAIVGQVLDKGLAGWVREHRQTGLVLDTDKDYRWLHLADEPYQAKSALGVPVIWGDELMAIMTLMHSQYQQFTEQTAQEMEQIADLFALILNSVRAKTRASQMIATYQPEAEDLEEILHYFPSIILILSPQGVIVQCGGRHLGAIALDERQSLGQSIFQLFADAPEFTQLVSHALAGNGMEAVQFRLKESRYDAWFSPIFDTQNQLTRVISVILPT